MWAVAPEDGCIAAPLPAAAAKRGCYPCFPAQPKLRFGTQPNDMLAPVWVMLRLSQQLQPVYLTWLLLLSCITS